MSEIFKKNVETLIQMLEKATCEKEKIVAFKMLAMMGVINWHTPTDYAVEEARNFINQTA